MKLYTFLKGETERLGASNEAGQLVDLQAVRLLQCGTEHPALYSMLALIKAGEGGLAIAREAIDKAPPEATMNFQDVTLLAPIPRPRKITSFSVYGDHLTQAVEGTFRIIAANSPDPEAAYEQLKSLRDNPVPAPEWYKTPAFYLPDFTTMCGHDHAVQVPHYTNWMDYELELVAVIGKDGKDIAKESAVDHIFGYSILNDLSARDAQLKAMTNGGGPGKGKDFDDSNPMGPCIVTADELGDPYDLDVRVRVNGDQWAESSTRNPHWTFADCIAHATMAQTMRTGDIFSLGCTPWCSATELQKMVKASDVIELEVDRIGVLRTPLI